MQLSDRVGRRMKLQDLHVLMTVMQAGSMGKAAQRLNVSQPAISRSIAELERTLGVRLLDRHRQGIEPTKCGRALLNCGVAVFDDLRQGVKSIEFLSDPEAGEVRIGGTPLLAASFVSAVTERLNRRYPRIEFHLTATNLETLHRELSDRNLDLAIAGRFSSMADQPMVDERLNFEFLYNETYVVAASSQNPCVRRRRIELAELVSEPWVLPPPESGVGSVATEAFRASGLEYPRASVITYSTHIQLSLLATGRFLTISSASALRFPTGRLEIKALPIKLPVAPVPNGVITLKDRTLSPVAQLFIECAREVAKPLAKEK